MVFSSVDARRLIRRMLVVGRLLLPKPEDHARDEMRKDGLTDMDAINVIRSGVVREAEWENGSWRYNVETARLVFVVTFSPEPDRLPTDEELADMDLVVVTGWRKRR